MSTQMSWPANAGHPGDANMALIILKNVATKLAVCRTKLDGPHKAGHDNPGCEVFR